MVGYKMLCSLCKNDRECKNLDLDDIVYGTYLKFFKRKFQTHGICEKCMPDYEKIRAKHNEKLVLYGAIGLITCIFYFALTRNIAISIFILLFCTSFSFRYYCPPLKE